MGRKWQKQSSANALIAMQLLSYFTIKTDNLLL
jgi:hypothetical protein